MRLKWAILLAVTVATPIMQVGAQSLGTITLRQIIADRPTMQSYVDKDGIQHPLTEADTIFQEAAQLLTNDNGAGPIEWSSIPPQKQCEMADHTIAQGSQHSAIRLGTVEMCNPIQGQPLGFERLWNGLFYELFNIQNDAAFLQDWRDATVGKYSECEYIVVSTQHEYHAELLELEFYKSTYLPWAEAHRLVSNGAYWNINLPATYEAWIAQYKDPKSYPWDFWGKYYKDNIVTYLVQSHIPVPTRSCKNLPVVLGDAATYTDDHASEAVAENVRGDDAMKQKQYLSALQSYQKACVAGLMLACRNLGYMYNEGLGVTQDFPKARTLYEQSCNGGNMWGCNSLAWMYWYAEGVPKDEAKAYALYTQSCNGGEAKGCNNLGRMIENGAGVPIDLKKAGEYFKLACDQHEGWGCWNLAQMYRNGKGHEKNLATAQQLMKQACSLGIEDGCKAAKELFGN